MPVPLAADGVRERLHLPRGARRSASTAPVHPGGARRERLLSGSYSEGWALVGLERPRGYDLLNLHSFDRISLPADQILRTWGPLQKIMGSRGSPSEDETIPINIRVATTSAAPTTPSSSGASEYIVAALPIAMDQVYFWSRGMTHWSPPVPT